MDKLLNSKIDFDSNSVWTKLIIYFPIFTTILCFVELIFFPSYFFSQYRSNLRFIQTVLLLNGVHVAFTYILLFKTEIGKNTLKKIQIKDRHFILKQLIYFIFFFVFFIFLFEHFWQSHLFEKIAFLVLFKLIPLHHTLRQNMGIQRYFLPKNFTNHQKLKIIYNCILFFAIWVSINSKADGLIHLIFFNLTIQNLIYILLIIILGALFLDAQKLKWQNINQDKWLWLYSIRIIPYLLLPFSILSAFAISSNHGIEYTGLYFKHLENEHKKLVTFFGLLIFMILIWPFFSHGDQIFFYFFNRNHAEVISNITLAFVYALTFVHYNLDYYLFKKA